MGIQGMADASDTYFEVIAHLQDLGALRAVSEPPDISQLEVNRSKTIVVNLDANHEYDGLMKELIYYAPFVSENSYLIVQDVKLDKIWGTAGPTAAVNTFLSLAPEGEFVVEPELKFHAYSQHIYLRRARVTVRHTYFVEKIAAIAQEMEAQAKK